MKQQALQDKDVILTVNVVEPGLVRAVRLHSEQLGRPLKGLALVDKDYAHQPRRPRDETGVFEEIICDLNNPNEMQRILKPFAGRILAATCRYDDSMQQFSKLIPFLPYVHTPSESAVLWSTEKPLMRDRLRNYDDTLVPKYQYIEISDIQRIGKIVKGFTFPLIIKPAGLSKALLVTRSNNMRELRENLERTFAVIDDIYQRQHYQGRPGILIEEMMQGEMYSVDAYVSHDGRLSFLPPVKVVTAHAVGLQGFYGHERRLPAGLSDKEKKGAFAATDAAISALNLSSTTTHTELIHTHGSWKIIEIAARIGGFRDMLYREAYGVEHFYNDLAVHMGLEPEIPHKLLRHASALNMYAETEGRIVSIEGAEAARELESVVWLNIRLPVGELAIFATEGGDPVIDAVLSNEDPKKLERDMGRLRELVDINVRPSQQLAIRRAGTAGRKNTANASVLK